MSDSFKIQQNVKVGNDLINLRADNPGEFEEIANWVIANAGLLVNVQTALGGVAAVAPLAGNVTKTHVQNDAPAQAVQQYSQPQAQSAPPSQGSWGQPQQQAPPSFANPATAAPACQHGPMVYREGQSAKGPWKAYFCPTPKGTPGQCDAKFLPKGS